MRPVAVTPRTSATIDFLRWFSATLVLLYHVRINVLEESALTFDRTGLVGEATRALTGNGPAGVMCFFVLSGYLVGGAVINRSIAGRFAFREYAIDRATRIYVVLVPALALGLMFDACRIWLVGPTFFDSPAAYSVSTIAGNLLFLQGIVVESAGSNLPLWSLAYEGWYYLLFPLMYLAAFPRKPSERLVCGLSFITISIILTFFNVKVILMFGAWLMGMVARYAPRALISSPALAWTIALCVLFSNHLVHDTVSGDFFLPAIAVANLLVTISHDKRESVPHRAKLHAWLANFSYSLYLTHSQTMHLLLAIISGSGKLRLEMQAGWTSAATFIALSSVLMVYAWFVAQFTEARTGKVRAWVDGFVNRKVSTLDAR